MIISIHIENATPEEIARMFGNNARLAEAVVQQGTAVPKAVEQPKEEPAPKAEEPAAKKTASRSKKKEEPAAPKAEEPAAPEVKETKADEPADEPKQAHTFDELRDLLTAKARDGKEIKPFLNSFGFERLSAVAADRIDEVYAKAEAL